MGGGRGGRASACFLVCVWRQESAATAGATARSPQQASGSHRHNAPQQRATGTLTARAAWD
eukprot:1878983-Prymnesium_polylepis.1